MNEDYAVIVADAPKDEYEELAEVEARCSKLFRKVKSLETKLEETKQEHSEVAVRLKALKRKINEQENKAKIESINRNIRSDWIEKEFPWTEEVNDLLHSKFKFKEFRPRQLAAINATLSKKDVLLVMPTGGGKSLVYQLPALIDKGITLVVSPLLSLIEDQMMALKKLKITTAAINSNTTKDETKKIYEQMVKEDTNLKLLFATPEWIAKSKRFLGNIKKSYEAGLMTRVAIDEVHCCSSWGHDFRPDYPFLGILRKSLPNVPFVGLTATATMPILTDIQTMLSFNDPMIITAPFNRPNLYYKVLAKQPGVTDYLENLLRNKYAGKTGIIYTTTVNDCVRLAKDLKRKGLKVAPYHGQLEPEKKRIIHTRWLAGTYQCVVATVAFGMGIDKPNVRFVIHHSIPRSMEALYQESGRAGRDGEPADCIVLYSLHDYLKVAGMATSLNEEEKTLSVLEYCLDETSCRRSLIAKHFEEVWDESHCSKMCDHCSSSEDEHLIYDITSAYIELSAVLNKASMNMEKLTFNKLIDGWFQTGPRKLRVPVMPKPKITKLQGEMIVSYLLLQKYLTIDKGYNSYTTLCYIVEGKKLDENAKIELITTCKYIGFPKTDYKDGQGPEPKLLKKE